MKYLLFIIAMCPFFVYAQDTDSTTISEDGETHAVYAELLGWNTNVLGIGKKQKLKLTLAKSHGVGEGTTAETSLLTRTGSRSSLIRW